MDADFLQTHWQREPTVLRGLLPDTALRQFTEARFFEWCRPPAEARLFVRAEELGPGWARAFPLESIEEGPAIYEHCRKQGDAVTLLLNHTEMVDPILNGIRARLGIPFHWREQDVVATLSMKDAGIGYHAGQEDGFIVQLRGARRWMAWRPEVLDEQYRRKLLGDASAEDRRPTRPADEPALTCILEPGDTLFLPALYAHEGTTLEDSISLSIAWESLTPFRILCSSDRRLQELARRHAERHRDELFRLLPDPPPEEPDAGAFLFREMAPALLALGADGAGAEACREYLRALTTGDGRAGSRAAGAALSGSA